MYLVGSELCTLKPSGQGRDFNRLAAEDAVKLSLNSLQPAGRGAGWRGASGCPGRVVVKATVVTLFTLLRVSVAFPPTAQQPRNSAVVTSLQAST